MNNILKINNITKVISKRKIINNVSFSINKGDIVGLVGENGAGKTTIMKIILGMISFNNGSINISGNNINIKERSGLKQVGSLIESPVIYPYLTGKQHLFLFSKNRNNSMINYLINSLDMKNYIDKYAKNYSLGMKQKLAIAISLVNDPKFVILDEPINGLDPKSTKEVRNLIYRLNSKGTTFLISSHILTELEKIINRVIIIKHGNKIFDDSLNNLSKKSNKIILNTNNNKNALNILNHYNVSVELSKNTLIINNNDSVQEIINIVNKNGIKIIKINTTNNDFEDELLKILDE